MDHQQIQNHQFLLHYRINLDFEHTHRLPDLVEGENLQKIRKLKKIKLKIVMELNIIQIFYE